MAELTREQVEDLKSWATTGEAVPVSGGNLRGLCDLALRALSAPAPQQTAPEHQELIARANKLFERIKASLPYADRFELGNILEALSRSLEDGRRAGLKEVEVKLDSMIVRGDLPGNGCDKSAERNGLILAYNAVWEMTDRALKTPKGGA